jgi:hypothetical protein
MKLIQYSAALFVLFGLSLNAEEAGTKVANALKGKLVGVKDGKAVDVELAGSPEYYVFYFSASW